MNGSIIIKIVAVTGLIYMGLVVAIYGFQQRLIYHPSQLSGQPADWGAPTMQVVSNKTQDGLIIQSWYQAPRAHYPIIVYFHGNAGHIGGRVNIVSSYLKEGFGVLLVGYRGYDGNQDQGEPSEQGLYKDGRAAMKFVSSQSGSDHSIVLVGESLGSGVATQMALEYPVSALILKAGFTSLIDVARAHYPFVPVIPELIRDRFDNLSKIPQLRVPVLFLHGRRDGIVPLRISRALYQVANEPKKMVVYNGLGHNDLMDKTFVVIKRFLIEQGILDRKV